MVASTLLGTVPPRLPGRLLVAFAEQFAIKPGTTRVALTRMVDRGELLRADGGVYELAGHLLERQERQEAGIDATVRDWNGDWEIFLVRPGRRTSADRAALRRCCLHLGLRERREGVWMRPDNLDPDRLPSSQHVVAGQTERFTGHADGDPVLLARGLFGPDDWAGTADVLLTEMVSMTERLNRDRAALAPGFELAAAVLRHLVADPLLPEELWPASWPAPVLREGHRRYDTAFRTDLARFFRSQRRVDA